MMALLNGMWCNHWKRKMQHMLYFITVYLAAVQHTVLGCANCKLLLRDLSGKFTSPCYPDLYPNSQDCNWTIISPVGFIVQVTFLDFDIEEAQNCMYDYVSIYNGETTSRFCGITAKGLTFNSTGNEMTIGFVSDFSIQKKGFKAIYTQVAVSLRNQIVSVPQNQSSGLVTSNVSIPPLTQMTVCFEATKTNNSTKNWAIFSYTNSTTNLLSFGRTENGYTLFILGVPCRLNLSSSPYPGEEFFTSSFRQLCIVWNNQSEEIFVKAGNANLSNLCPDARDLTIPGSGKFMLGSYNSTSKPLQGDVYNFRLWNISMGFDALANLTCDNIGNIINWENRYWNIPSWARKTESKLSCGTSLPVIPTHPTTCEKLAGVCQATSASTMIATNMTTNSTDIPETGGTFYRIGITVISQNISDLTTVQNTVFTWLNTTFQFWNYSVYVVNMSIQADSATIATSLPNRQKRFARNLSNQSYVVWALLVYNNSNNIVLEQDTIMDRINQSSNVLSGLTLKSVSVSQIEFCPVVDYPASYHWPLTRPNNTQEIPCPQSPGYTAKRTCFLGLHNFTTYWGEPDTTKCTSANAGTLANELLNLTAEDEMTAAKVENVVQTLMKIVNDAEINADLGTTVVNVFSNILSSSDSALTKSSSDALKTIEALALKIQFSGPSVSIVSRNLCLGVSKVNATSYNGSSFSVGAQTNNNGFQIDMNNNPDNPLASVVLPSSLLSKLSESDFYTVSRAQFTFFSKAGLFQDSQLSSENKQLNSYIVSCSIGNISIYNLIEPVRITVKHRAPQENGNATCVFWDTTLNSGHGGWSQAGCKVLINESNANETVCLCNHLTNFGILMDLQRTQAYLDPLDAKILTFITYIGCGISAICTAATLLTYIAFEKIRRDYPSKILMNLSTALLFLNLFFLLDSWLASFEINELCIAVAALLHFFLLATFTWMGLEAVHMYIALVKVFNTYIRRYILKFCIIGWGVPAIVVAIVLASTHKKIAYGNGFYGPNSDGTSADPFCWINDNTVFYVTCVAYFGVMFLMNVAMFIVVMVQICGRNGKRTNRSIREEVLRNLRSVVSLTFLLGMTWGFAFFAWGKAALAFLYLFTIFNSLQGLFIFVFHCALKENVQKQWRRHLCCGKLRLPDNSDWSKTATNNTKKVSSDNLGKSLSTSSIGSNSTYWTSKSKSNSNHFFKRNSSTGYIFGDRSSIKFAPVDGEQTSILPVHHVIDKVKGYCHPHSDNFYKNIIMSDSFNHSTKF
ncbi:adhesion G-protein coupled receptor G6 isoform X5 [Rana temporaria]|uniref:adhesion G-protein coupled receptor G6 isoform X5 n=1 Tax=Rana temporaria TaxID=8407 RepID=UPI001AAD772B|nr:adhesion G-protein coupled receptor G6 isoform X5 [Rana temporaria]